MDDLVSMAGLAPILDTRGIPWRGLNFEQVYSDLASAEGTQDLVAVLERTIFDYFNALESPPQPTLYDHLILSLRPKDVVATFNWDPFLFQAGARAWRYGLRSTPVPLFLHGNVAVASCLAHRPNFIGPRGTVCGRCGEPLAPSPLLYPVTTKDYATDPFVARTWELAQRTLRSAYVVTIFGYSAPRTDAEAVKLLKTGWGDTSQRSLEEVEIIDIKPDEELAATWDPFIHTHHYRTTSSFYDSLLGKYPRRVCEAVWGGLMELVWPPEQSIPREADWSELVEWYRPFWRPSHGWTARNRVPNRSNRQRITPCSGQNRRPESPNPRRSPLSRSWREPVHRPIASSSPNTSRLHERSNPAGVTTNPSEISAASWILRGRAVTVDKGRRVEIRR